MARRRLADVSLDQHLTISVDAGSAVTLQAAGAINQALGVLIGLGHTPEQADLELDACAAHSGMDRHGTAALILATIPAADSDLEIDIA